MTIPPIACSTLETRHDVTRLAHQRRSEREIHRCLMRHLTRRLFPLPIADLSDAERST